MMECKSFVNSFVVEMLQYWLYVCMVAYCNQSIVENWDDMIILCSPCSAAGVTVGVDEDNAFSWSVCDKCRGELTEAEEE